MTSTLLATGHGVDISVSLASRQQVPDEQPVFARERSLGIPTRWPTVTFTANGSSGWVRTEGPPIFPHLQPLAGSGASCMMMEHERDDYELAVRARAGDREALAELVDRTRLRLFQAAYAEPRHYDDAHDAVASALLQICLHIRELREPARLRAWMRRIVSSEVRRLRRGPAAATLRLEEADLRPRRLRGPSGP